MSPLPAAEALPFDIYSRYQAVASLAQALGADPGSLTWAEVGAGEGWGALFLPRSRLRLYDTAAPIVAGAGELYQPLDIAAQPLPQGADIVFALDTLEHIPRGSRREAVARLAQGAQRGLLLAGPFDQPDIVEAEAMVEAFVRTKIGAPHRFLMEHRQLGLPNREDTLAWLGEAGLETRVYPLFHLPTWGMLMTLHYLLDREPRDEGLLDRFNRWSCGQLFRWVMREPSYRHLLVGLRAPSQQVWEEVEAQLAPPSPAGPLPDWGQLQALLEGARLAADQARDQEIDHLRRELAAANESLRHERAHVGELLAYKARVQSFPPVRWARALRQLGGPSGPKEGA